LKAFPANFTDVHQTLFTWQELHKHSKGHYRNYGSIVYIAHYRYRNDTFNPVFRFDYSIFVNTKNADLAHIVYFFYVNRSSGFALNFLNHFTAWANHRSNEFFIDKHLYNTWCVRFHIRSSFRNSFVHMLQNMESATSCLFQCLTHYIHGKTIYFNIHLYSTNTIASTCYFKVHISEMVFIA